MNNSQRLGSLQDSKNLQMNRNRTKNDTTLSANKLERATTEDHW